MSGKEPDQVDPEMDTVWQLPDGAGDAIAAWCRKLIREAEQNDGHCPSLAQRSFARAVDKALDENDRLGLPSPGGRDGKVVMRQPGAAKPSIEPA